MFRLHPPVVTPPHSHQVAADVSFEVYKWLRGGCSGIYPLRNLIGKKSK
jgi:hypothetical protein